MSKSSQSPIAPEHTAVRVALWRALHLVLDPDPPIFNDPIGAELVAENNWQQHPDMNPEYVSGESIYQRYFAMRSDGLRAGQAEAFLIAST